MALILPLTLKETSALVDGQVVAVPEQTFPAAYVRILFARAHADRTYICVCWYKDEAARFANENPVKMEEYSVETGLLVGAILPAAYNYIKTLEDFAGATDHPITDPAEVV